MAKEASISLLFLSFLIFCCSGTIVDLSYGTAVTVSSTSTMNTFIKKNKISQTQTQTKFLCFFCSKSSIMSQSKVHMRRVLDDTTYNTPTTVVSPTNPASSSTTATPITIPPDSPAIISVPSTNNQGAVPITVPSTTSPLTPIPLTPTNPANSPLPVTNPVTSSPITVPATTNPVTFSYPPPPSGTTLLPPSPPAAITSTTTPGQSWCVAKTGVPQTTLQSALDYACGMDSTVCSQIQQGGSCYNPNSLQNHASVAFNSYYQKNPAPTSCDFGGAATLVNTNPSSGTCIYSSSPASSSGGGPFGPGSPASGSGFQSPPPDGDADTSHSARLRPCIGCMALLVSLVIGRLSMK